MTVWLSDKDDNLGHKNITNLDITVWRQTNLLDDITLALLSITNCMKPAWTVSKQNL